MKKSTLLISIFAFFQFIASCANRPPEPISYVKQPSTGAETAVAKTLKIMISAYNNHDIDRHLSCYAPDAKIETKFTDGVVSKDEFRQILEKNADLPPIQLKDIKFIELSPVKFQVDAILSDIKSSKISYELVPLEGRWVILKQRFK